MRNFCDMMLLWKQCDFYRLSVSNDMNKFRCHLLVMLCLAIASLVVKWKQISLLQYETCFNWMICKKTAIANDSFASQGYNTGLQTNNSVLPEDDDAYEFLYGKEYEHAIEKAANATKKVIVWTVRLWQLLLLLTFVTEQHPFNNCLQLSDLLSFG